ncbi:MAG TPA: hypothetical protein VHD61_12480 [Lacunisphaera sp.]|nr:hypothetical protein [Lacunisphaera sp.]
MNRYNPFSKLSIAKPGAPHSGHKAARSETWFPQSGQAMSAIKMLSFADRYIHLN